MAEQYQPNIGHLCDDTSRRDCVHIAVAPVTANERLLPGQPVGVLNPHLAHAGGPHVGLVDPFLKEPVNEGEKFWLFLYPNTITGLRHMWSHPAFIAQLSEVKKL